MSDKLNAAFGNLEKARTTALETAIAERESRTCGATRDVANRLIEGVSVVRSSRPPEPERSGVSSVRNPSPSEAGPDTDRNPARR